MATECARYIRSCVARVTRLDNCGRPVIGPASTVVTEGYISIAYSPDVAEGEEVEVKNACGKVIVSDKACNQIKRVGIEVQFAEVDPDVFAIIGGEAYPLVMDAQGDKVGFDVTDTLSCNTAWALEAWTELAGEQCAVGSAGSWGYFLAPWIRPGTVGDFSLENDSISFSFAGATRSGTPWGTGPYNVQMQPPVAPATEGVPGKLITPVPLGAHTRIMKTTVAPPTPACGAVALAA